MTVSSAYDSTIHNSLFTAVLEINFGESDYCIEEGGLGVLSSPITLQFRTNQNPFTVMLSPVTVATAEGMDLEVFINSMTIDASSRATKGTKLSIYDLVSSKKCPKLFDAGCIALRRGLIMCCRWIAFPMNNTCTLPPVLDFNDTSMKALKCKTLGGIH